MKFNERAIWAIVLSVLLMASLVVAGVTAQTPTPDDFSSNIFFTDGGNLMIVASGGEVEMQDGSYLDVAGPAQFSGAHTTATPMVLIAPSTAQAGNIFEVRNPQTTPVFSVNKSGTLSHATFPDLSAPYKITVPTAQTTATPGLQVDSLAADGDTFLLSKTGGTPVAQIDKQGILTMANGETISNDADNSIAFGFAAGTTTLYGQNTVSAGGDGVDLTQTLLAMDGSDVYAGIDMNLTNADQGGTSHIRGIDLNLNAADAQATESGVYVAGVWDYGAYLDDGTFASGDVRLQNSLVLDAYTAANLKVTDGTNTLFTVTDAGTTGNATVSGALGVTGLSTLTGGESIPVNVENIMQQSVLSVPITWTAAAGGTGVVATIGSGEIWIVTAVLVNVTTNFDCTGDDATLVVGDGDTPAGFVTLADAELQTTDTEGTGFAAGWQGMTDATIGVYLDEVDSGFVYQSTETIDWLVAEASGTTLTAGAATIYVIYTRIL